MMHFEPVIPVFLAYTLAGLICFLLFYQLVEIKKTAVSRRRKLLRLLLNTLLSLALIGMITQPSWEQVVMFKKKLVVPGNFSRDDIRFWKDSLEIQKHSSIDAVVPEDNPLILVGSGFSREDLSGLQDKEVHWISTDSLPVSNLNWKGLVRLNEIQYVRGKITANGPREIRAFQGDIMLDEQSLQGGEEGFELKFPSKVTGRSQVDLFIDEEKIQTLRFYTAARKPRKFRMQLGYPSMESRILFQWLQKQGEEVVQEIEVSRNTRIGANISNQDTLDILIVSPDRLGNTDIRKEVENGSSVLVMQFERPERELGELNRMLGTTFKIEAVGNEEARILDNGLETLPFRFLPGTGQQNLLEQSVVIGQVGNARIAASIIGPSFPRILEGDSIGYSKIWDEILGSLYPPEEVSWSLSAPVFTGLPFQIQLNQRAGDFDFIPIANDTLFLQRSLVNPNTKSGSFIASDSGWVSFSDSLEVYLYRSEEYKESYESQLMANFLTSQKPMTHTESYVTRQRLFTDWMWLIIIICLAGMVWVEPKLDIR